MDLRTEKVNGKNKEKQKIKEIMAKLWQTKFLAFYDEDTVCGFVYMAVNKKLIFIMFFAVDENIRLKGYGSRILEKIQSIYPDRKRAILRISSIAHPTDKYHPYLCFLEFD